MKLDISAGELYERYHKTGAPSCSSHSTYNRKRLAAAVDLAGNASLETNPAMNRQDEDTGLDFLT